MKKHVLIAHLIVVSVLFGLGYYLGMDVCGIVLRAFRNGIDLKDAYLY